jgi:hypothetical protein
VSGSLDRVREALWEVFEDLRRGDIDEDQAAALTGVLDSLAHTLDLEARHEGRQRAWLR